MVMRRVLGGRYQLVEVLGHGGVGTVWRADDLRLGIQVAVDVLDAREHAEPGALDQLRGEGAALSRLTDPHIVRCQDFGIDPEAVYLALELVDGPSLAAVLAHEVVPVDRAVDIARQVCTALAVAHAADVVHGHLDPGQVLLARDGTVKVRGFRLVPADPRTDLHALGRLLAAMLREPVPADLDGLVRDLLSAEPPSAVEAGDRLDARRPLLRRPITWWAAGAAAVAVLLLLLVLVLPRGRSGVSAGLVGATDAPTGTASGLGSQPALTFSPEPDPAGASTGPATPAGGSAAVQIAALQTAIGQQAAAGQLDARAAADLRGTLSDIARRLGRGQTGQAASRVAQLRERLTELAREHKLSGAAYQQLRAGVDALAGAIGVATDR